MAESDGGSNICYVLERMLCVSLKLVELLCSRVVEKVFERERERASYFLGESASPFIVERDGLTSQREREKVYTCAA